MWVGGLWTRSALREPPPAGCRRLKGSNQGVDAAVLSALSRWRNAVSRHCPALVVSWTPRQDGAQCGGPIRLPDGLVLQRRDRSDRSGKPPALVAVVKDTGPGAGRLAQRNNGASRTKPTSTH